MFVRVVAGCAPCRVAPLAHGATLQRSAAPPFPTGSCDPSGAPKQNTLGALPQDPCRWLCWIRIDFRREPKINPYCAQNRSQGSLRQHLPLPPCGARKNLRTIRSLDFFDRYGFSASLRPPPAALGSESPHPLSRGGKGARMGGQVQGGSSALGEC